MNIAAKIGLGALGAAAVGGAGYFIYQAIKNESTGIDNQASDYIAKFDINQDQAVSIEYEARRQEDFNNSTYVDNGDGTGYYSHSSGTKVHSMVPLAQAADRAPIGNGDGVAGYNELVALMKTFDTGDGEKHPAGDAILGGQELRNFRKAYAPTTRTL